jgi:hypothetical protein
MNLIFVCINPRRNADGVQDRVAEKKNLGHAVAQLVGALRYKPEGR